MWNKETSQVPSPTKQVKPRGDGCIAVMTELNFHNLSSELSIPVPYTQEHNSPLSDFETILRA